jgi:hypothetical protein
MNFDEIQRRNIATMGDALGKQYTIMFHEVTALHLYWKEFIELFGTNDKRIERLNDAAAGFFMMLQEQQFETNMMHIARLTDSPRSVGKDNLTLLNLPSLVPDTGLKAKLVTLVEEAKNKCAFAREWRNRRFAHHDLMLATQDGKAVALKRASKESVNAALEALSDVLNAIEGHYYRGMCDFNAIAGHKGAATLLYTLGFGVKAIKEMEAKIASGKFDDLGTPENI